MNRRESIKPKRLDALSRELLDELLVYDGRTHRGHCLNRTAAAVWRLCDGETTIPGMIRTLQSQVDPGMDEQIVRLALARLKKAGLLADGIASEDTHTISRRDLMRKIGKITAIALPVVTSMLIPTAARAASCFPLGHGCSLGAQCCSGHCGIQGISLVCLP